MNIDYSVTDDQKHALKEDGIVKLPGLINSSLLKELNKCFDWSISNHGPIASFTKINNSDDDISFVDNGNPDAIQLDKFFLFSRIFPPQSSQRILNSIT